MLTFIYLFFVVLTILICCFCFLVVFLLFEIKPSFIHSFIHVFKAHLSYRKSCNFFSSFYKMKEISGCLHSKSHFTDVFFLLFLLACFITSPVSENYCVVLKVKCFPILDWNRNTIAQEGAIFCLTWPLWLCWDFGFQTSSACLNWLLW